MDKKLEIRLIESGYNPSEAEEVPLAYAGRIIKNKIYKENEMPVRIFFDGPTQVTIRTGLSHVIIEKESLAIDGASGGLYLHSIEDEIRGERSSLYIGKTKDSCLSILEADPDTKWLKFAINNENKNAETAVELLKLDNTKALYLAQEADTVKADKLFWQYVAKQAGLQLTEIKPEYTDKSPLTPWYTLKDDKTGINLTLGTRYRVYAIKSEFPKAKSAEELQSIVKGLRVSPQSVNGEWNPEFDRGGKSCETHISRGAGDQVLAYMTNLLGGR